MNATDSRIARTKCAFPWRSVSPYRAARASGSYSGLKAPTRWGSKVRPSAPAGTAAARPVSRSYGSVPSAAARATSSVANRSRNHVSAIPPVGLTGQYRYRPAAECT